jgi:hypothetical protein
MMVSSVITPFLVYIPVFRVERFKGVKIEMGLKSVYFDVILMFSALNNVVFNVVF